MPESLDTAESAALVSRIIAAGAGMPPDKELAPEDFVRQFFHNVPPEDLRQRHVEDLYAMAASMWRFAQYRKPGTAILQLIDPRGADAAWCGGNTVLQIVNDDMPFLVDSVTAALNGLDRNINLIVHPVMRIERGLDGALQHLANADGRSPSASAFPESILHVEIRGGIDQDIAAQIVSELRQIMSDIRAIVVDWAPMVKRTEAVADSLSTPGLPVSAAEASEVAAFLSWLIDDNFTFLGYRDYSLGDEGLHIIAGSGRGILANDDYRVFDLIREAVALPPDVQQFLHSPQIMMISKSNQRSTVHRPTHLDTIGIKTFDSAGAVVGQRVIVGLFTSASYHQTTHTIPVLRRKIHHTMERAQFAADSHDGKALRHILDTYPRDELFQISEPELFTTAMGILYLQDRWKVALFVRRDPFERYVSCLVYVPRDRYSSEIRRRIAAILAEAFQGTAETRTTLLDESVLARVHLVVMTTPGRIPVVNIEALEDRVAAATRVWADILEAAALENLPPERVQAVVAAYRQAFPIGYTERLEGETAIADIALIERVAAGLPIALTLSPGSAGTVRNPVLKTFRAGEAIPLSDMLPVLENMGFRVLSEQPFEIRPEGISQSVWLQEFILETQGIDGIPLDDIRPRFIEAFPAIWFGEIESDGFNRLITQSGLTARQIVILRSYAKFLRQAGTTFSQSYIEDTLVAHPDIAARLIALFEARFDPDADGDRQAATAALSDEILVALDAVVSLDEDTILRNILLLIERTLRTNFFQIRADGTAKTYLSIKLASRDIPLLPLPRPMCEIFVYSPQMEGIHLRGGKVARGGIRWSDRREDFRKEILGLMKAQQVKNAVIVPLGSKGGFVVKRMPKGDREQVMAEVVACYKTLMSGMLDLTDNLDGKTIVPPARTVRYDGDDAYLVVAADKGTATFSDIANGIANDYGFWLGDGFASGGSMGYDHKRMAITARGAWEAVKRHFREIGTDIQTSPFTCIGVGDMSGDVFGNGMLLSKQTRLIAAFDHRHIIIDPDPDTQASWTERQRLFALPRSSWADYDRKLLSMGGGIYERTAKSIHLAPEAKARFGIAQDSLSPTDLIQILLKHNVDLLWFGGIGTFIKAATESHVEAGDKTNDLVRVDGRQIRASVIGEGANLGVTQRGRIEFAQRGGRINTDAIDNSAGVDTSDHEVNIKIALASMIESGHLTPEERPAMLTSMTDEIATQVLRDNYLQTLALSLSESRSKQSLDRHIRLMRSLEKAGKLDRTVEFLPDDEALALRKAADRGLTRPELAVLLAYVKNNLSADLVETALPEDKSLDRDLLNYFPRAMIDRSVADIERHALRREIIVNCIVNEMVNRMGITFVNDLQIQAGSAPAEITHAWRIVSEVFDLPRIWQGIEALDGKCNAVTQIEILHSVRDFATDAVRWVLKAGALDIIAAVEIFKPGIERLSAQLASVLSPDDRSRMQARGFELTKTGLASETISLIVALEYLVPALDILNLDIGDDADIVELARLFFTIADRLGITKLREGGRSLVTMTPWQEQAVASLADDLGECHREIITRIVERSTQGSTSLSEALGAWVAARSDAVTELRETVKMLDGSTQPDLAMIMVATRRLRALL